MDHQPNHHSETPQSSGDDRIRILPPAADHGAAMWRVARDSGTLDLNTSYAYLLMARDFAATTRVALQDGEVVGFVLGYRRPDAPQTLFVWQIAVDDVARGRRIGARLLDSLVDDLSDVTTLETTITADNAASNRLFASFAERHGAAHSTQPLFAEADFPDEGHPTEHLHVIGDLGSTH
ncbi:diaminobutyrate acetyltransferase [Brachybacterium endophyticum]|uniref:L-2,4-diaminobutyric acid acetyltransferase n=1 Tax=Brachybacterium endophyticum TaxID=2182385 RepID=A0A2U2RMI4_9MICO|nr:diaminobutyrate acetyltransferase [Brachybacterium endophyticum]